MTEPRYTMAFVMDPIREVSIDEDTTFVMMLEAQRRGHRILYVDPGDLLVIDGRAAAHATDVTLRREKGNHVDLGERLTVTLDEDVDVAFQRVDPPVDAAYVIATQILGICTRCTVLNEPRSILAFNEKIFALHFADLMTDTRISRRSVELLAFLKELGGEMILKPLDGRGGEGVFHLRKGDPNLLSIIEQSTRFGERPVMAQRFLPQVRDGDKRILLLDGEILGAVYRIPDEGEVRANFHVGGKPARAGLDERDRAIVDRLRPVLRREGLFLVGIDVIGGHLTEINVTSPTGVQEVNALEGARLEERILDGVEARLAARD